MVDWEEDEEDGDLMLVAFSNDSSSKYYPYYDYSGVKVQGLNGFSSYDHGVVI